VENGPPGADGQIGRAVNAPATCGPGHRKEYARSLQLSFWVRRETPGTRLLSRGVRSSVTPVGEVKGIPLLQCAVMKPSLKALPPSEWRIMYVLWCHGPLTVAEVHRLSPEHNLTTVATLLKRLVAKGYLSTTVERSPSAPGRPPERYFPKVDYQAGLALAVQEFLASYLFNDPAGLSYLASTAQQRLDLAAESRLVKTGDSLQLGKPS